MQRQWIKQLITLLHNKGRSVPPNSYTTLYSTINTPAYFKTHTPPCTLKPIHHPVLYKYTPSRTPKLIHLPVLYNVHCPVLHKVFDSITIWEFCVFLKTKYEIFDTSQCTPYSKIYTAPYSTIILYPSWINPYSTIISYPVVDHLGSTMSTAWTQKLKDRRTP